MDTILLTFGFFVAIIFAMSIGFIIKGKTIAGSCGGITALGMKKMCDCDTPCSNLQAKLDAGDEDAKAEYEQKFAKKETPFYEVK